MSTDAATPLRALPTLPNVRWTSHRYDEASASTRLPRSYDYDVVLSASPFGLPTSIRIRGRYPIAGPSLTSFATAHPGWLSQTIERLRDLQTYEDNYDGRGSQAPSPLALNLAASLLLQLSLHNIAPDKIVPVTDGGVALYFFGGGTLPDGARRYCCGLTVYNDGSYVQYFEDRVTGHVDAADLRGDALSLDVAIDMIRGLIAQ